MSGSLDKEGYIGDEELLSRDLGHYFWLNLGMLTILLTFIFGMEMVRTNSAPWHVWYLYLTVTQPSYVVDASRGQICAELVATV